MVAKSTRVKNFIRPGRIPGKYFDIVSKRSFSIFFSNAYFRCLAKIQQSNLMIPSLANQNELCDKLYELGAWRNGEYLSEERFARE
jgi:hypothetical protein